jgi:hypothetical protein
VGRGQCRTRTGEASLICPHSVPAGVPGLGGDSSSPWRIYPSLMPGGRRSRGLALPPPPSPADQVRAGLINTWATSCLPLVYRQIRHFSSL